MIDLAPAHLALVQGILAAHIPDCTVRAYGSRVKGKAWNYSDLDLVVGPNGGLQSNRLEALREAFACSDLPIIVEVQDWEQISPAFRHQIASEFELLQTGTQAP